MQFSNLEFFTDIKEVICSQPETPLLCFNPDKVKESASTFLEQFPGVVSWALKSNPHPEFLRAITLAGINNFCVASRREIEQLRYQCPNAKIRYTNPIKSIEDISFAYKVAGVHEFTIDDPMEIIKIEKALKNIGKNNFHDITIAVRFRETNHNSNSNYEFGKKFGADTEEAIDLLLDCTNRGFSTNLSFHPGSQTKSPDAFVQHIDLALHIIEQSKNLGVDIKELNIGGGFPAPYFNTKTQPLEHFFQIIEAKARELNCRLHCEPGRALVAESASLVTRINLLRDNRRVLHINDGMYGSLMESKFVDFIPPVRAYGSDGGRKISSPLNQVGFKVAGPTCDSLDFFDHEFLFPSNIMCGDYIEFGMMGAYTNASSTSFNGFTPAKVVLVDHVEEW